MHQLAPELLLVADRRRRDRLRAECSSGTDPALPVAVARQPAPPGKAAVNVHRLRPGLRRWPDSRRRKHPATVSPVASRVLRVVQPGGVAAVARLSPADKGGAATARGSRCATVAPQSTLDQRRLFAPRERFHPSSQSANVQGNLGLLSLQGPDSNPGSGTLLLPANRHFLGAKKCLWGQDWGQAVKKDTAAAAPFRPRRRGLRAPRNAAH